MTKKKSGRVALAQSTALRSASALKTMTESSMPISEYRDAVTPFVELVEAWAGETIDELVSITTDDAAVAKAEMAAAINRRSEKIIAHFAEWADAPDPIPA